MTGRVTPMGLNSPIMMKYLALSLTVFTDGEWRWWCLLRLFTMRLETLYPQRSGSRLMPFRLSWILCSRFAHHDHPFQWIHNIGFWQGTAFLTLEVGKRMIKAQSGGVFLAITTHYTNEVNILSLFSDNNLPLEGIWFRGAQCMCQVWCGDHDEVPWSWMGQVKHCRHKCNFLPSIGN